MSSVSEPRTIAVLPGDGIGPEIVDAAITVLKAVEQRHSVKFNLEYAPIGGAGIDSDGVPLPAKTLELCQSAKVVFLGAVGDYKFDDLDPKIRPEQGLLQLRKALGLYANLRPVKAYDCLLHVSTLKPEVVSGIDIMVVRELTGGLYFGQPKSKTDTEGLDTMRYSRPEIERIAHVGFQWAQRRRKQLCSVDKANVLYSSQLWRDVVTEVGKAYPDVELSHMYVDNAAMQLIRNPKQFDVLLTENTFGDILSDEASMLTGSLGMLASASLGEGSFAMYEPSHGSAPKYAGLNKVNPIAQIMSLAMMLEHSFGMADAAQEVEQAIVTVLEQGIRTYDITDERSTVVGTSDIGQYVAQALLKLPTPAAV
jgi:3-isopropylmalate dehydrogenase